MALYQVFVDDLLLAEKESINPHLAIVLTMAEVATNKGFVFCDTMTFVAKLDGCVEACFQAHGDEQSEQVRMLEELQKALNERAELKTELEVARRICIRHGYEKDGQ